MFIEIHLSIIVYIDRNLTFENGWKIFLLEIFAALTGSILSNEAEEPA